MEGFLVARLLHYDQQRTSADHMSLSPMYDSDILFLTNLGTA